MRIVVDANVLVSAFIWGGIPAKLLVFRAAGLVEFCAAETTLIEIEDVLRRPKFSALLAKAGKTPDDLLSELRLTATLVSPGPIPPTSRDHDDDVYLATAVASQAQAIVSGDKDLLAFGSFEGIPILKPAQFIQRFFPDYNLNK